MAPCENEGRISSTETTVDIVLGIVTKIDNKLDALRLEHEKWKGYAMGVGAVFGLSGGALTAILGLWLR